MRTTRVRWLLVVVAVLVLGEALTRISDAHHHYDPNIFTKIAQSSPSFRGYGPDWYAGAPGTITDSRGRTHAMTPTGRRVLCLGGSTTEGQAGNDYPGFLGQHAELDVINAGVAGYATPHTISTLALNGFAWAPSDVVVQEGINDLHAAYFPDWRPDLEHKFGRYYGGTGDLRRWVTPANALFQDSHLYWYLRRVPRRLELAWRYGPWRGEKVRNPDPEIHTAHYGPTPPADAIEGFRRNLTSIAALCRGRARLVLVTQPWCAATTAYREAFAWKPYNHVVRYPEPDEMAKHHEVFNDVVRQVAVETNATLVDAARQITDCGTFQDSVHLTPEGNRRLADAVYAALDR